MADEEHRNKTVRELKDFLRQRDINTSIHRKPTLIRLCEAASAMSMEPEEEEDVNTDRVERRTIEVDGKPVILEDILSISTSKWEKNLTDIPNIENGDVMIYLLTVCKWSKERLKNYKADRGYQLFKTDSHHIDNVLITKMPHQHYYVKSTCVPQDSQGDKPYMAWLLMDDTANIKSGGCNCPA